MNSRVFYTLIRLAVVCTALGLVAGCDDVSTAELKTPVYKTGMKDSDDNKTSAFRKEFPLQAASYDRNNETEFMSKYKGSKNLPKNSDPASLTQLKSAAQPYLKNLWLGYPFMYEYNEARGHTYARRSRTTTPSAAPPVTTPKPCSSSSTASRSRTI